MLFVTNFVRDVYRKWSIKTIIHFLFPKLFFSSSKVRTSVKAGIWTQDKFFWRLELHTKAVLLVPLGMGLLTFCSVRGNFFNKHPPLPPIPLSHLKAWNFSLKLKSLITQISLNYLQCSAQNTNFTETFN